MSATPTQEELISSLADWRRRFDAGRQREWGLFQPKLAGGERFGGMIPMVGATTGDPDLPVDTWSPGVTSRGFSGKAQGAGYFTSERLLIQGNRRRIVREWRWADLAVVRVLPAAYQSLSSEIPTVWGVMLLAEPDGSVGEAVASKAPAVGSQAGGRSPLPGTLWLRWLKVEAAFVASRGADALDRWFAALPQRALVEDRGYRGRPPTG